MGNFLAKPERTGPVLPALLILLTALLAASAGRAQNPVGEVFASDASIKGSMTMAGGGMKVMSGSTVVAGAEPALLKLARGGEVRVCSQTQLTLGTSPSGRDLMLGMNPGALEAQYTLGPWADTVMTPDFRILVAGPGTVHFSLGVEPGGDTCIRTLSSNTVSLLVSELLGEGAYQVKSTEQVVFHGGHVGTADQALAACGCPAPPATREATKPAPGAAPPPKSDPPRLADEDLHIEVDAPFVFRATDPQPPVEEMLAQLRLTRTPGWSDYALPPPPQPLPVPEALKAGPATESAVAAPAKKPHVFGRLRAFFASIFR